MSKIEIQFVLNGWIIRLGRLSVVFIGKDRLIEEISKYLDDPSGFEKRYVTDSVNSHIFQSDRGDGVGPPDKASNWID